MDFEFYRNFCVIAETENITKASQKLNIAQTALSSQVKKLEQNYGVQLLKTQQGKKKSELTAAGVVFLKRAKAICRLEDDLVLDMQEFSSNIAGTISIAASHNRARFCLEKYVVPFIKLHPDINYKYSEITVDAQVEAIRNGTLDFAFANAAIPYYPELDKIALGRENFYVLYDKATPVPWQDEEYILPSQLNNLPICTNELQFHTLRKAFSERDLKINIKYLANTVNICINLCKSLPVIGVVACMEEDPIPENMLRKQIKAENIYFEPTFFWNKNRQLSPAANVFLTYFQKGKK